MVRIPVVFVALAATSAVALAHDYKAGSIEIGHPWSRATPPGAPVAGGFMTLSNTGTGPDRLVRAESPVAAKVEIHEMKMDGSVMRMRELESGLSLPPGGRVELRPGGYHIMFIDLKAPLRKDDKVPVTLVFEKAGRVEVEMQIEAVGASGPGSHRH